MVAGAQTAGAQLTDAPVSDSALPVVEASVAVEGIPRPFGLSGGPPRPFTGRDYQAGLALLRASIPDLKISVLSRDTIGDRTIVRLRFTGRFTGAPLAGFPANGAPVQFDGIDMIDRNADGQVTKLTTSSDVLPLLRAITVGMPASVPIQPIAGESVYRAQPGDFIESLAVEPDGGLLMSMLFAGRIDRLKPDGTIEPVVRLPNHRPGTPGFICLVRDQNGTVFATMQGVDAAGNPVSQLWQVPVAGEPHSIVTFPAEARPNGLTLDGRGGIIVGDNVAGLWRVDPAQRTVQRWSTHPLLSRRDYIGELPAANGVQRRGDMIHVTNSDRGLLLRIPMTQNAGAGVPEIVARGVPGDDFALDSDGTAYVTTHPHDSIMRVAPDGTTRVIATAAQGMAGPTSAVIVKREGTRYLYVANDGGIYANRPVAEQTPGIVRYRLEPGK